MTILHVGADTPAKSRYKPDEIVLVRCHHWTGPLDHNTSSLPPVPARVAYVHNALGRGGMEYVVVLLADAGFGWYKGDTYRARPYLLSPYPSLDDSTTGAANAPVRRGSQ